MDKLTGATFPIFLMNKLTGTTLPVKQVNRCGQGEVRSKIIGNMHAYIFVYKKS
jgi:hypothetical protein